MLDAFAAYELEGEDSEGRIKPFEKPWCMTTVMFLGMSFCLPLAYLEEYRARKGLLREAEEPLLGDAQEVGSPQTAAPLHHVSQKC